MPTSKRIFAESNAPLFAGVAITRIASSSCVPAQTSSDVCMCMCVCVTLVVVVFTYFDMVKVRAEERTEQNTLSIEMLQFQTIAYTGQVEEVEGHDRSVLGRYNSTRSRQKLLQVHFVHILQVVCV